jgi:hypothetical protein
MIRQHVLHWARNYAATHAPDFVIGDHQLDRWWLIPRNKLFNIYLHRFNRSDEDRALHDHPWVSVGWILNRGYNELLSGDRQRWRKPGSWTWRLPTTAHRVILSGAEGQSVYTLFLTGPVVREWGFHCPQGWRHWKDFVSIVPGGNRVGRGCE